MQKLSKRVSTSFKLSLCAFVFTAFNLGACSSYNKDMASLSVSEAPPPPVVIPDAPREKITTIELEPYNVASLEPSAGIGDIPLRMRKSSSDCEGSKADMLGYKWGKNSIGLDVKKGAALRYRMSLGDGESVDKKCQSSTQWHGFAYEGYSKVFSE